MNFYGLLDLSWLGYIVTTLVITHITIVGITVYLHRCQAHGAITLHPIVSHFFRAWLWFTTGMITKAWTAIHRKHHAKCETEEDPHSPNILGLKKLLLEGAELYRISAKDKEMLARYGKGTPDDWMERNIYTKHSALGIILMVVINLLIFGVPGLAIWAIQMCWTPIWAAGVINGIGHCFGYRNNNTPDTATNISPIGIFIGGEELHNNHHAYPSSAKFSMKAWEFDIGWFYISVLRFLKLAKVKRTMPKSISIAGKNAIDDQTLTALLINRQHVMTSYVNKVMLPILTQAKERASIAEQAILKQCKKMLRIDMNLLDAAKKQAFYDKFSGVATKHKSVELIYGLQQQLHEIWNSTTASQKELIEAFQAWCKQAEASGLQVLEEFTSYLKGYSVITCK